jgi:hypothetical protein
MSKKVGRFLVLFIFVAIVCAGVSAFSTPQAHATTCQPGSTGDSVCTGQDPVDTGCANNVSNVASTILNPGNGSNLNDMWSATTPSCETNWPQANIYYDFFNAYTLSVSRDAGGGLSARTISASVSDCAEGCYGNMVYAPTQPTEACITGNYNACAKQPGY